VRLLLQPHYYQSLWFWLAVAAGLLLLAFAAFRLAARKPAAPGGAGFQPDRESQLEFQTPRK